MTNKLLIKLNAVRIFSMSTLSSTNFIQILYKKICFTNNLVCPELKQCHKYTH